MSVRVHGFCPMGCGETLFLGAGGHVTCSLIDCPDPCAGDTILDDPEHEHVVVIGEATFGVQHHAAGACRRAAVRLRPARVADQPAGALRRARAATGAHAGTEPGRPWSFEYLEFGDGLPAALMADHLQEAHGVDAGGIAAAPVVDDTGEGDR